MESKKIEQLEREDPSAETLALTNIWKELVKPNDDKMTDQQHLEKVPHTEISSNGNKKDRNRIAPKIIKLIRKRMKEQN